MCYSSEILIKTNKTKIINGKEIVWCELKLEEKSRVITTLTDEALTKIRQILSDKTIKYISFNQRGKSILLIHGNFLGKYSDETLKIMESVDHIICCYGYFIPKQFLHKVLIKHIFPIVGSLDTTGTKFKITCKASGWLTPEIYDRLVS